MSTLWFVVPAAGRLPLADVCLRQLRRTCDQLTGRGILASAVVVADDENLDLARQNGFGTVESRPDDPLGRKLNDGYQAAGREGVQFMVPLGNDDWIDPDWITLPGPRQIVVTHRSAIVNETCTRAAGLWIGFGDGVRVYPRQLLSKVGFRPACDDRGRAMDASTHGGLRAARPQMVWNDGHPLQIVDFKSAANLNPYRDCLKFKQGPELTDPLGELARFYPAVAIREMQALHARELVAA